MKIILSLLLGLTLSSSLRAGVLPNDAVIDGRTISEWTAEWWKWIYAQPTNQSPLLDPDGSRATNGQPGGSVFFVANIATPGTVARTFAVPEGSYLLFPVRYVTLDNLSFVTPLTVAELRDTAAGVVDLMMNLHVTIDGQSVDVSSHRVLSPVFNFDFQSPDNLDSFLDGIPVTGLVDPIVSDGYWIMVEPLSPGPHIINFGGDIGPPYNSTKDITDTITVVPANHPPVADASATRLRYIAGTNGNAKVVLDGSRSSDPDNDPLTYRWLEGASLLSQALVSTNVLSTGSHEISLVVSDGSLNATNTITVQVLTITEALEELEMRVGTAGLPPKRLRALLDPLEGAAKDLHRGDYEGVLHELREFRKEVREQMADPTFAQAAQEIADVIGATPVLPPAVLPNDSMVDGRSLSEWTAEWWKWAWLQPTNHHVWLDADGRWATNAQPASPVFFVAGVVDLQGNASHTRAFVISEDNYLFIGLGSIAVNDIDTIPPLSIDALRAVGANVIDAVIELHATIDGVAVPELFQHRLTSPAYNYYLPDANNFQTIYYGHPVTGLIDPEISDGYWVMLAPLSPGVHVIDWGAALGPPYNFRAPMTDIVTVVPIPLAQRVQNLIASVQSSGLPKRSQRELLDELKEAARALEEGHLHHAVEELMEFQKQVRREIVPLDPAVGEQFIQAAQTIIDKAESRLP